MIKNQVDIKTKDGHMESFVFYPERDRPHPVVLFFMDALGIRRELFDMAQRLATSGYYVIMPNLYYRSEVLDVGPHPHHDDRAGIARIRDLTRQLTIAQVMDDVDALIEFTDAHPAAAQGPLGCVGYCMSGRFAISAAARHRQRVAAAASIYGTLLKTEAPDSPHLAATRVKGELYIGFAEIDPYVPAAVAEGFTDHVVKSAANAEVEVYRGKEHGFTFPSRAAFDQDATERHWERLISLWKRRLK